MARLNIDGEVLSTIYDNYVALGNTRPDLVNLELQRLILSGGTASPQVAALSVGVMISSGKADKPGDNRQAKT